jgi:hypothetical protein
MKKNHGFQKLKVKDLVKASWNYKTDDPELKEKLRANIKRNGIIENLIVRELGKKYEVVNGNHRFEVLLEDGVKEVMVYNLGDISLPAAQRIAYETNETKFENDQIKLSRLMNNIMKEFEASDLVKTMALKLEDIDALTKLISYDPGQYKTNEGEIEDLIKNRLLKRGTKDAFVQLLSRISALLCEALKMKKVTEDDALDVIIYIMKEIDDKSITKAINARAK